MCRCRVFWYVLNAICHPFKTIVRAIKMRLHVSLGGGQVCRSLLRRFDNQLDQACNLDLHFISLPSNFGPGMPELMFPLLNTQYSQSPSQDPHQPRQRESHLGVPKLGHLSCFEAVETHNQCCHLH